MDWKSSLILINVDKGLEKKASQEFEEKDKTFKFERRNLTALTVIFICLVYVSKKHWKLN